MKTGIKTIDNLPEPQLRKIASVKDERKSEGGVYIHLNKEYESNGLQYINEPGVRAAVLALRKCKLVPVKLKFVETLKDIEQDPRVKKLNRATPKKGQNTITFAMGGKKLVGTAQQLCDAINKLS